MEENRRYNSQDDAEEWTVEIETVFQAQYPETETAVIMCGVVLLYMFHTLVS
jgi:hypothetical protein